MNQKETRWRQRFDNFEKAFMLLEKHIGDVGGDELVRAGITKFFEMALELA